MASLARGNTANRLSPSPLGRTTTPSYRSTSDSINWSWRTSATRICSGYCSQSLVEPLTFVKRKVTVPVGRAGIAKSLLLAQAGVNRGRASGVLRPELGTSLHVRKQEGHCAGGQRRRAGHGAQSVQ